MLTYYDYEVNDSLVKGETTLVIKMDSHICGGLSFTDAVELTPEEIDKMLYTYEDGYISLICFQADSDIDYYLKWLHHKYPTIKLAVQFRKVKEYSNYLHYALHTKYINRRPYIYRVINGEVENITKEIK